MRRLVLESVAAAVVCALSIGCTNSATDETATADDTAASNNQNDAHDADGHAHEDGQAHDEDGDAHEDHGHSHEGDDVLFWEREFEREGLTIKLGHHGTSVLADHEVEPAVSITRGGESVADLEVYNSLVAPDGETVLQEEVRTVYEPATDDEPAHYAQGALNVPHDVKSVIVRYRIMLAADRELRFDVQTAVQTH